MERRLSAILAADVVGYSAMMEQDEAGTVERLRAGRHELFEPEIAKHHGRIFKLMGDGLLVEFGSVVNAVECAVALQRGLAERNANVPDDRQIQVRIGINLGEVIVEGDDRLGEGVNIATRLEQLAEPGGIYVSGKVAREVEKKLSFGFESKGDQKVKNIAEPVSVYRVVGVPAGEVRMARSSNVKPSIAVLPFVNMSGDAEQDYFSDGVTEDLITQLSRFRELVVISRNSSFVFKGKAANVAEIARKLGVQFIVEGSIRKAGPRIRVTAQLIDADHDVHIWAERYDTRLEDIFDLQDEVVRTIAATLVGRLENAALERSRNRPAGDLHAYEQYLKARRHLVAWTRDDNRKARELLEAVIASEPEYAAAHATLAEAVARDWLNAWSVDPERDFNTFHELAVRSVQLDDGDSRTHVALGFAALYHGQPDRARAHLQRALQVNPSNPNALVYMSRFDTLAGNPQSAIDRVTDALKLNPFGKYGWYQGQAHYAARRYDEAAVALKGLSDPTAMVWAWLAACQAMSGDERGSSASASALIEAAKTHPGLAALANPVQWRKFFADRWPFRSEADLEHLFEGLRRGGLPL